LQSTLKRFLKKILYSVLPENKLLDLKNKSNIPSMEWSLKNVRNLGFIPEFAVDVGAFNGEWTKMFKRIYPAAKVLMVEAQESKKDELLTTAQMLTDVDFSIALLGSKKGEEVNFYESETTSSVLIENKPNNFPQKKMTIELLDDIVFAQTDMKPDFLKLDVQGFELEVLKGSTRILDSIQMILCEVSLLEINVEAPLISEVINYMKNNGFVPYDICSFIRRPLDRALWQTDILFVKETNSLRQNKFWK
jgi:FkbM family methyltransferase